MYQSEIEKRKFPVQYYLIIRTSWSTDPRLTTDVALSNFSRINRIRPHKQNYCIISIPALRYILQTMSGLSHIPTGFAMAFFLPLRIFVPKHFKHFAFLSCNLYLILFLKAQNVFYFSKCYQQNA